MSKVGVDVLPRDSDGRVLGKIVDQKIYSGDVIYYPVEVGPLAAVVNRWPNGSIVFDFAVGINITKQNAFWAACQAWAGATPIACVPRTIEPDFVLVTEHFGGGCGAQPWVSCAPLGFQPGVRQMEIFHHHWTSPSLLQHEIGHVIGFIHEHQRTDRSQYVQINYDNVTFGNAAQFNVRSADIFTDYDYVSIMHYGNCDFSVQDDPSDPDDCLGSDPSDEWRWTVFPRPCGVPDLVGGSSITALDLDGVRGAYAPAVVAVFRKERKSACGTHYYSQVQVNKVCGANCTAAEPTVWRRVERRDKTDCGAFVPRHPPSWYQEEFCTPISKELKDWDYDSDPLSCGFPPTTRHEWWADCGCSTQALTASCANFASAPNRDQVLSLIDSDNPKEQAAGHILAKLNGWYSRGNMDEEGFGPAADGILAGMANEDFLPTAAGFFAGVRVYMAVMQARNPKYRLRASTLAKIAKGSGL